MEHHLPCGITQVNVPQPDKTILNLPTPVGWKAELTLVFVKNDQTYFCQNFIESPPKLIIFGTQIAKTIKYYVRYTHCAPHLIYVNALPCKMQMLQIVA